MNKTDKLIAGSIIGLVVLLVSLLFVSCRNDPQSCGNNIKDAAIGFAIGFMMSSAVNRR